MQTHIEKDKNTTEIAQKNNNTSEPTRRICDISLSNHLSKDGGKKTKQHVLSTQNTNSTKTQM